MNAFSLIVCVVVVTASFKQADAFHFSGRTIATQRHLLATKPQLQQWCTNTKSSLFNSGKDDIVSDNSSNKPHKKRDIVKNAIFAVKKSLIGLFALVSIVILGGPKSAVARGSNPSSRVIAAAVKSSSKSIAQNDRSRGKEKVRLDVVVEDDDGDFDLLEEEKEENQKLTRIGLLLVGATGVATILLGDGGKKSKKAKKVGKSGGGGSSKKSIAATTSTKIQKAAAPKGAKPVKKVAKGVFDDDDDDEENEQGEESVGEDEDETRPRSSKFLASAKSLSKMADDENETLATASRLSSRLRKGLGSTLPSAEELFGDDEEISKIFKDDGGDGDDDTKSRVRSRSVAGEDDEEISAAPRRKSSVTSKFSNKSGGPSSFESPSPVAAPAAARAAEDGGEEDGFEPEVAAAVTPTPAPAPAPAKKGIFDRIFQRSTTQRPTDIEGVLQLSDAASFFRYSIASALAATLPQGSFPLVQQGGVYAVPDLLGGPDLEAQSAVLANTRSQAGLDDRQAAEAFADVANAMLVTLVDRAADALDARGEKEVAENAAVEQLDLLTSCAQAAGELFMQVLPGVILEDGGIKYNGGVKKNKLENLYFHYTKASMGNMGDIFAEAMKKAQQQQQQGDGSAIGDDGQIKEGDDGAAAPEKEIDRAARLPVLQHVLSIKESKRTSLEQKATKEVMMSMPGMGGSSPFGGGMGGGLGDMMGALTGGGKGGLPGAGMDEAAMQELINSMGAGGGAGGAMPPGMPDLGDMTPDQMAGMFEEVVVSLKQSLQEGTVTKQEVQDLEKQLGMPLKDMVKMMEMGGAGRAIPQFKDLLDVFKQLSQIK